MTTKFTYQCCTCGKTYQPGEVLYLCPECNKNNKPELPPSGVLKTIYTDPESRSPLKGIALFKELKSKQFIDILPVDKIESFPKLRIGQTPLYLIDKLEDNALNHSLYLKDDSQNPTWSFKDRASALVSAYAKENKIETIVAASTGNAGSSLAGICASQRQKAIILVPETAPLAKLTQIIMYGATLVPVKGTYDDAFDLSVKASEIFGWYNRNTAYNPLTIDGKKTVVFEIFEQMNYCLPDKIFVPVGDGVIISGVYKGFEDLLNLGIIDQMPVIVAVQAQGSNNLIRNMHSTNFEIISSQTVADSISVDIPRNFYMARDYMLKYNGEILSVTDEEILNASSILSKNTGLFAEPASAAAFAGYLNYVENKQIADSSKNLVLLTGSGLKDLKSLQNLINMPQSISPEIEELHKLINAGCFIYLKIRKSSKVF